MCTWMWKPDVNVRWLSWSLFTVVLGQGLLLSLELTISKGMLWTCLCPIPTQGQGLRCTVEGC